VISIVTAHPYTVLVAVALVSIMTTTVVVRTRVVVQSTGTDYSAMQHMISDLQHSKRTNWGIHTNVQSIQGKNFRITSVAGDHMCFETIETPYTTPQTGCLFYSQIAFVLTVDGNES
jgi:hypothetical protein